LNSFLLSATIIGLVADIIAIVSVLLAIDIQGEGVKTLASKILITEWHLFGLWLIAGFTYLGFLYKVWENDKEKREYIGNFWFFLIYDFILKFRLPFYLLPIVVLLILFVWIFGASGAKFLFFVLFFLGFLVTFIYILHIRHEILVEQAIAEQRTIKDIIDKNWKTIENRILNEISHLPWIEVSRFRDLAIILQIDCTAFKMAFAKFSLIYPTEIFYGDVYKITERFEDGLVRGDMIAENALISRSKFDYENFYFK